MPPKISDRDTYDDEYYAAFDGETNKFNVECEEGVVMEGIDSWEAAEAMAVLCSLGHVRSNAFGEFVFTPYAQFDPYQEEEEALNADDAPDEDTVEITVEGLATEQPPKDDYVVPEQQTMPASEKQSA